MAGLLEVEGYDLPLAYFRHKWRAQYAIGPSGGKRPMCCAYCGTAQFPHNEDEACMTVLNKDVTGRSHDVP